MDLLSSKSLPTPAHFQTPYRQKKIQKTRTQKLKKKNLHITSTIQLNLVYEVPLVLSHNDTYAKQNKQKKKKTK